MGDWGPCLMGSNDLDQGSAICESADLILFEIVHLCGPRPLYGIVTSSAANRGLAITFYLSSNH